MLGLPSTTEVMQRIPKEAFYRNMSIDARTKEQFVSGVERIVVMNAIRPSTANLADGMRIHEILVVQVEPKGAEVPETVIQTVLKANPNPMVVVDGATGSIWANTSRRSVRTEHLEVFRLVGPTMDEAWDSILAQMAFRVEDGADIQARLERKEAINALEHEIEALDRKCRKEQQISRRNELFVLLKVKKAELSALKEDH